MDKVGLPGCSRGSTWVPLLRLVALDKRLSGGSDSNWRGPRGDQRLD